MGQNFLTADWVPERIADEAGLDEETGVIEVGPGIGCLTEQLSMRAGKVVSIELDSALKPVLAETMRGRENVEIIFGDVLKSDLPAIVKENFGDMRAVVCANLPYNITSPLLTAFIEAGCFESITVMIQREVARRICAREGTADYGAFTVYCNWHTEPEILFDVPPSCFVPQPKVTSSVIRLTPRKQPPVAVSDEKMLFRVVRAAFNQRRKTLVNALSSGMGLPKEQIEAAVVGSGFDARVRGEVLSIADFARLTDAISAQN
jgi:16S rRNA (adenine1518-N6/adenine1519-N6)-dimethyltransferase